MCTCCTVQGVSLKVVLEPIWHPYLSERAIAVRQIQEGKEDGQNKTEKIEVKKWSNVAQKNKIVWLLSFSLFWVVLALCSLKIDEVMSIFIFGCCSPFSVFFCPPRAPRMRRSREEKISARRGLSESCRRLKIENFHQSTTPKFEYYHNYLAETDIFGIIGKRGI